MGTKHKVTAPNGKMIHRKNISKPIDFKQEHNNRGNGPRGPDGRLARSPLKHRRMAIIESESEPEVEAPPMETESPKTPEPSDYAILKRSTFGRGKPKITEDRPSPGSPLETPGKIPELDDKMGPLTINTSHMTETEIRQAIQDAETAEQELFIRDENSKVPINSNMNPKDNLETALELANNLSSSTEIEADIVTEGEKNVRRPKRLTKTNPIVRYNNPICHDYRKHRKRAELGQHTVSIKHAAGEWKQQTAIIQQPDKIQTLQQPTNRDNIKSQEQSTVQQQYTDHWRNDRQNITNQHYPIGRTSTNSGGGTVV